MRYEFEEKEVELLEDDVHIKVNDKDVYFSFYACGYTNTECYQKQTRNDPFEWEYDIDIIEADWIAYDENENPINDKDVDNAINDFIDDIFPYDWDFRINNNRKKTFESWKKLWKNAS